MTRHDKKEHSWPEIHPGQIDIHSYKIVGIDRVENHLKKAQEAAGNIRWLPGYSAAMHDEMRLAEQTLPVAIGPYLETGDLETADEIVALAQGYHEQGLDAAIILNSIANPSVDRLPETKAILGSAGARLHMAEYLAGWYALGNPQRAREEPEMGEDSRRLIVRSVAEHFDLYTGEAIQFVYRASKANAGRRVLVWATQLVTPAVLEFTKRKEIRTAEIMEEMHQVDAAQYS